MDHLAMDIYKRYKELYQTYCYECNGDSTLVLPAEILNAVDKGEVNIVRKYLDEEGNVNALQEEECLLSRACAQGQLKIVNLLLECPGIHVNISFNEATPLDRAAKNGHMSIVKILLDTPTQCRALPGSNWKLITKCLRTAPQLHYRSASHLLRDAIVEGSWEVIELLLDTDYCFFMEDLQPMMQNAINQNRWDIVYRVLEKNVYGLAVLATEAFAIAVTARNWENAKKVARFIARDLKFDIKFAELAHGGNVQHVQLMLQQENYDSATLNGNFLVAAASSVNADIADLLMSVKNMYTRTTYANALMLSIYSYCTEITERLLFSPETSFTFAEIYYSKEILLRHPRYANVLHDEIVETLLDDYLKDVKR